MPGTWFYERPYCTYSNILFLFIDKCADCNSLQVKTKCKSNRNVCCSAWFWSPGSLGLWVQVWQIPRPCPRLCPPTRPVTSSACPSVRWDPGPMPIPTNRNTRSAYLMKSPCVLCKQSPSLKQPGHISSQGWAIAISVMSPLKSHPLPWNMIYSTNT